MWGEMEAGHLDLITTTQKAHLDSQPLGEHDARNARHARAADPHKVDPLTGQLHQPIHELILSEIGAQFLRWHLAENPGASPLRSNFQRSPSTYRHWQGAMLN